MLKNLSIKEFGQFLKTLHVDREQAAEKYVALHERLERFFEWRDCEKPEELTDIVFDRVSRKITAGEKIENAEAFCVSVAKFVLLEHRREVLQNVELDENSGKIVSPNAPDDSNSDDEIKEKRFECLDKCLAEFPADKRELLINYFDTDEATMIRTRRNLAEKLEMNLNTLRIRVSRLKTKLEKCTKDCCDET
jgi:DNA-directed RNA polymerase specialized sigma24 family protein